MYIIKKKNVSLDKAFTNQASRKFGRENEMIWFVSYKIIPDSPDIKRFLVLINEAVAYFTRFLLVTILFSLEAFFQ